LCFEAEIAQAISCCHAAHLQMALCHSLCYTKLRRATFLCRQPPGRPLPKCFRRPLDMTAVSGKKGLREMDRAFFVGFDGVKHIFRGPRSKCCLLQLIDCCRAFGWISLCRNQKKGVRWSLDLTGLMKG